MLARVLLEAKRIGAYSGQAFSGGCKPLTNSLHLNPLLRSDITKRKPVCLPLSIANLSM
jgi:hypothetical protein